MVGRAANLRAAHHQRAPTDANLIHSMRRRLACPLHLFEHRQRLGQLACSYMLIDDGRVRGHQPHVEALRHALQVLHPLVHPWVEGRRKLRLLRCELFARIAIVGTSSSSRAHDLCVRSAHFGEALRRFRVLAAIRVRLHRQPVIG